MNSMINENLSLKYEKFKPSGFKEKGIRKFEFAATTQFLSETSKIKFRAWDEIIIIGYY